MRALPLVIAAAVTIAAHGQQPARPGGQQAAPQAAPTIVKAGNAIIVGRVVEAGTTTGVAAATVTLSATALGTPTTVKFSDGTPGGGRRIVTDQDGRFVFHGLPAGSYLMVSLAPGWVMGGYGMGARNQRSLILQRSLDLTDSDRAVPVTIQMMRPGGISGRVLDEAGEPMVNAPVTLLAKVAQGRLQTTQIVMTDDRGMYHADDLPGEYLVAVIAATTTVPSAAVDGFNFAQREGGATFQAYLSQIARGGSLLPRGVGARIGGFLVSQYGTRNAWVVPPITERDGRPFFYPTTFHPSNSSATGASAITIGSGEERTGIDIVMRPQPARRVSGRLLGPDGAPVGNAAIRLLAPDMSASEAGRSPVNNDTPSALADGNGNFTFIGIAPGSYIARVLIEPATPAEPILWAADSIVVSAENDETNRPIRLSNGAKIAGRVVAEGSGPALSAADYKAIGFRATALSGTPGSLMAAIDWMNRPDESGRFTSGEYVPGLYQISVPALPPGWIVQTVTIGGRDAIDRPFELTASGITDLVITVSTRRSQVTGIVRDSNGQPVPLATVAAFPVDQALWPANGIWPRRLVLVPPARDGRYEIRGLPAGDYFIAAFDSSDVDIWDPRSLRSLAGSATRITLSVAESRTLDLALRR